MITRLDLPIHERLDLLRVDSGLRLNQVAKSLNVMPKTVSQWGYGQTSPAVWHAIAYAALVGHRLILVRRGIVVCELRDVLQDPAAFRKRHRLSQQQVADRMRVSQHSVSALELRVSKGADVSLATLLSYLAALGYQVVLAPVQPMERAAASTDRAKRRKIICKACGKPGENRGYGWCIPCYSRWASRGRPASGPPAPYENLLGRVYKPLPIPAMCRMKRHPLVGDNLVLLDDGSWRCSACHNANRAAVAARESAAWHAQWNEIHDGHDVVTKRDGRHACRTCIRGDADIDEIAIERAEGGDPPSRLTIAEREAAIVHLRSYGLTYALIAERVGCCLRTAWWTCNRLQVTDVAAARVMVRKRAA